ncbi:LysR family transcriptional regulator [Stenotrophomonas tuberculopleuritidis]|uniref:LysR family transcriptional regulator n=1 Tax=Stenotrophomonas tuberculopleuritidis TaxID=3055079 RepID=UPI0026E51C78|nr:LysR family transcriptional regulator [Stenotrophomonas sp. 704A1]
MTALQPHSSNRDGRDSLGTSFSTSYAGVLAFIAVAEEGSFGRAGDRLGIGRSAVSRAVQKLECQLGVRLFLRTTRETTLTREGELFYEGCSPGVASILRALDGMRDLHDGPPRGHLRVSASHGFGRRIVAPLLSAFRNEFPDVSLELVLEDGVPNLVGDRVDVAFRDGLLEDSHVVAKHLVPMQRVVCASRDYQRANGVPLTVEQLADHVCIGMRTADARLQRWEFRAAGRSVVATPQTTLVFDDPELVFRAVLEGHGIAQLPSYQVGDALRDGTMVTCLDGFAPLDQGHYLCYLSRHQLPKRIRAFVDFSTRYVRELDLDVISHWQAAQSANASGAALAAATA